MELEKCKRPGCDVRGVEFGCCGDKEIQINCAICNVQVEHISKKKVAVAWHGFLVEKGLAQHDD